jgi:hypothetical protein
MRGEWSTKEERGKKNANQDRKSELNLRSEKGISLHRQVWAEIEEVLVKAAPEVEGIIAGRV